MGGSSVPEPILFDNMELLENAQWLDYLLVGLGAGFIFGGVEWWWHYRRDKTFEASAIHAEFELMKMRHEVEVLNQKLRLRSQPSDAISDDTFENYRLKLLDELKSE